jgi:uncharacterized protein (TIGR00730 family)
MQSLSVFCGSCSGNRPEYLELAREVGETFAAHGLRLIYGGGRVGMMGAMADAALNHGGEVVGVIPEALMHREVGHRNLTQLHVVETLSARKLLMAKLADGFIVLPGGIGTMDELFEVWTWSQFGAQRKPAGILNAFGYYDGLIGFLEHATTEGLLRPQAWDDIVVDHELTSLLTRLATNCAQQQLTYRNQVAGAG